MSTKLDGSLSARGAQNSCSNLPSRPAKWKRNWNGPVIIIIGFYMLALLCAVVHNCVFNYLDGRVVNQNRDNVSFDTTTIPQSHATTISLVLVTAFRAALTASIGYCYTQYLWKNLRSQILEVGLIEELFQIRNNAVRLLNPALARYTPVLLSIALFSWLVPLAMIYPPGALVVGLETRLVDENFNISVIPPAGASNVIDVRKRFGDVEYGLASIFVDSVLEKSLNDGSAQCDSDTCFYLQPSGPLRSLAKSVLLSSSIVQTERPSHGNFSYSMTFQGPMLHCEQKSGTNVTMISSNRLQRQISNPGEEALDITLDQDYPVYNLSSSPGTITLEYDPNQPQLNLMPCPRAQDAADGSGSNDNHQGNFTLMRPLVVTECLAATAEYNVNITSINGVQQIRYSANDVQPLPLPLPESAFESGSQDIGSLRSWREYATILALIDSLASHFHLTGVYLSELRFPQSALQIPTQYRLPNGTDVEVCSPNYTMSNIVSGSSTLLTSAFNKYYIESEIGATPLSIDFSEALLNEALANITISALSLNTWYDVVHGSSTKVMNVYHFERKLSFYLPYGLCLLLTLPVLAVGLLALRHNGVSAIDGGFVQILMTTTGHTELDRVAMKGCLGGEKNIPKELEMLKIRFGELLSRETCAVGDVANEKQSAKNGGRRSDFIGGSVASDDVIVVQEFVRHGDHEETRESREAHGYTEVASGIATVDVGNHVVRRAGFGVADETKPLQRSVRYGWTEMDEQVKHQG
ncbi:hypothetical protein P153DRAFT_359973 [Dothidotthia symphoricarpi CBS 119687]|uniref:Uncharacterized protein n=1 Tax=Dothidotthia symphoricarpi CBS 119687 TaxID=1392245 RepID=A0A6A6A4U5_9PLEO|nr:uncharacterized protein P153DRAFT_359973 [Dothidotthia symphoricarpi CBS 119687]KAF2125621.1 hypothetical protein P153DRAFT_359973 [Dothidotthia symphoricarpi CBS 119687]